MKKTFTAKKSNKGWSATGKVSKMTPESIEKSRSMGGKVDKELGDYLRKIGVPALADILKI